MTSQSVEERLHLVVEGVTEGDAGRAQVCGRAARGRTSRLARRRLQVALALAHGPADHGQRNAECGAVRRDQRLVIL